MSKAPPPSRLRLDTSPPLREVEDRSQAGRLSSTPERGGGVARSATEGGASAKPSRTRRKPGITERARKLRWVENSAEGALWQELKGHRLGGHHFVRQHPTGPYFADFCCRKSRLVVEIDGSQHADSVHDRGRDEFMHERGYSTLRFWSHDALKHRSSICDTILAALDGRLSENTLAPDLRFVFASPTESFSKPTSLSS